VKTIQQLNGLLMRMINALVDDASAYSPYNGISSVGSPDIFFVFWHSRLKEQKLSHYAFFLLFFV